MKRIGIISAGAWGTAIGQALAQNGHSVCMWDFIPEVVTEINNEQSNSQFLFGVKLHQNIVATNDLQDVIKDKDFLILATPSKFLLPLVKQLILSSDIQEGKPVIGIITKGFIDNEKNPIPLLLTQAVENILPGIYKDHLVYISGPSHAEEVARGKITGLISASKSEENAQAFKEILTSETLKIFTSPDIEGVQICAAIKNVVAIAYGLLDAMIEFNDKFGDNTESFLFAAGLNEIMTLGIAMGSSHPSTFTSLAGVGDLDVTCKSKYGRNRRFGKEIIKDKTLQNFKNIEDLKERISEIGYLPEGVFAVSSAIKFVTEKQLELPIITTVYRLLNKDIHPKNFFSELFN